MTDEARGAPGTEPEAEAGERRPAGAPGTPPHPADPGVMPPRPRTGVRGRGTRRGLPDRPCLNCGDPTPGEYCRSCGQRKVAVLVSVRAMFMDLLEDEFLLNRRLPRTLSSLVLRPGFLTVEHVNGRIARYIRPLRLYLASSIVFFLLFSFFSLRMLSQADFAVSPPAVGAADSLGVAAIDSLLAGIDETLSDSTLPTTATMGLEQGRRALEAQRARALAGGDTLAAPDSAATRPAPGPREPRTVREMLGDASISVNTGVEALDSALVRRARLLGEMTPRQAAERLIGESLNYVPTMMFVLLPVFALALKLLYVRRRRFYAEHFVFLLHTHAFVFLIFTALLITRAAVSVPNWLIGLLFGWVAVYIYVAMKRVYGQGWFRTLLKYWALGWFYLIVLSFSVPLVLAVSILLL